MSRMKELAEKRALENQRELVQRLKKRRNGDRVEPLPRRIFLQSKDYFSSSEKEEKDSPFSSLMVNFWGAESDTRKPLLAEIHLEGWTEEYVIFVDYSNGGGKYLPELSKSSTEFLSETAKEISTYVAEKQVSIEDGDLLLGHLYREIEKRL